MSDFNALPGVDGLRRRTSGDPRVCVAVLDGPVDLTHPSFAGVNLTALATLASGGATGGAMSRHGTHVASVIFGRRGGPVPGLAPGCRGLIVPIFSDAQGHLPQLDLARAIDQAVEAGANVINVSGGQKVADGKADELLERAIRHARDRNVVIVAAAGNDGCACLHVPAASDAVPAVGAVGGDGRPLPMSNWGAAYRTRGLLAPGEEILGAAPGGGTVRMTGTSFATPIVTGVVALLLSRLLQTGQPLDPARVRDALLQSANACDLSKTEDRDPNRCLAGTLNVPGALNLLEGAPMSESLTPASEPDALVAPSACDCQSGKAGASSHHDHDDHDDELEPSGLAASAAAPRNGRSAVHRVGRGVRPSDLTEVVDETGTEVLNGRRAVVIPAPVQAAGKVYALGTLGYDFGTEARRDTFKQMMPPAKFGDVVVPANPYDSRQIADYLDSDLSEARSLIWVVNLEMTPIYAVEPVGPFARDVYEVFRSMLKGQIEAETNEKFIQRVSVPGVLPGRTVRLFSGQTVPVIEMESPRGVYGWRVNLLVDAAVKAATAEGAKADDPAVRRGLKNFLNRVYYDLRNLGVTAHDRALNFAATNAFQVAGTFSEAVAGGMELAEINVVKSPICRIDSDCWDVMLKFFDPENDRRAKRVFRFTIDVSDIIPVTLGEPRSWTVPY